MKEKSKMVFKKYSETKVLKYECSRLMGAKQSHSKMDNLSYSKLEMQEYFQLLTKGDKKLFWTEHKLPSIARICNNLSIMGRPSGQPFHGF